MYFESREQENWTQTFKLLVGSIERLVKYHSLFSLNAMPQPE